MIAFSPEPQTRLIVVALVLSGGPRAAQPGGQAPGRPGLQHLAHQDPVDRDVLGESRTLDGRADRDAPELDRRDPASAPPNLPIGVRAALTR